MPLKPHLLANFHFTPFPSPTLSSPPPSHSLSLSPLLRHSILPPTPTPPFLKLEVRRTSSELLLAMSAELKMIKERMFLLEAENSSLGDKLAQSQSLQGKVSLAERRRRSRGSRKEGRASFKRYLSGKRNKDKRSVMVK